jgi:GDP-mannose transporter
MAARSSSSSSSSKQRRLWFGLSQELVSGAAFCVTSASMTLLNKAALSAFHFGAPTSLLCFQCTVTLLLVLAANAAGYGRRPALTLRLLRLWLPVNVLFVGMVWVSSGSERAWLAMERSSRWGGAGGGRSGR